MSMNEQDRSVIESLFTRLGDAERQAPPRDVAAEDLIHERIRQQPSAPYFMAQTLVMQEYALQQAQQRIEELERRVAQRPSGGGIFSNLFGGGQSDNNSGSPVAARRGPTSATAPMSSLQPGRGGGFLAGAAQTAMGVAGGVLLGNAIAGMFGGNEAQAAEPAPADSESAAENEAPDENVESFDSGFGDDDSF